MQSTTNKKLNFIISKSINTNEHIMYIKEARTKFVPAFIYYMLEHYNCDRVSFNTSLKEYPMAILKDKQTWKDVDYELKQTH